MCRLPSTDDGVEVTAEVVCVGRTGIEMEALTAVTTALLTVYDMCKAVDKGMRIQRRGVGREAQRGPF